MPAIEQQQQLDVSEVSGDTLLVAFAGRWRMADGLPSTDTLDQRFASPGSLKRILFDAEQLASWDSGLLTVLVRIIEQAQQSKIETDYTGLPDGIRRLLDLAFAVPEKKGTGRGSVAVPFLDHLGTAAIEIATSMGESLTFLGESILSFGRLLRGRARFRRSDLILTIQECGADALPIVTLISLLIGVILAFIGGVQMQKYGAETYVADLVGIGMAREMAAVFTGIILAGRTGAAFAAQLGTMTVNEEIDALKTMGISPMDFLVLPRMLALILMMPLLCLYADLMGVIGGAVIGLSVFDIPASLYWYRTHIATGLDDVAVGLVKGAFFGVLIATAGCQRGMQCGRSAAAVGIATTSAVVFAIVQIVLWDALFAVVLQAIGW